MANRLNIKAALEFPGRLLKAIVDYFVALLTESGQPSSPSEATNIRSLRERAKLGDVILVCGNARISYVVKVLTLSPWSHVVLYVGDRRDLLTEEKRRYWRDKYGESSMKHLVIDADPVSRVHLKPIDDYAGLMLRQCRAEALSDRDLKIVSETALSQLGRQYDIKHIIRLLFFFAFPWELLPQTMRSLVTDFTLSEDDRICSRVLSEAFHSVGYPIRPVEVIHNRSIIHDRAVGVAVGLRNRGRTAVKLLMGGRVRKAMHRIADKRYTEIHLRGAKHITPADYDLSRFFSIIKDEQDLNINYREAKTLCPMPDSTHY